MSMHNKCTHTHTPTQTTIVVLLLWNKLFHFENFNNFIYFFTFAFNFLVNTCNLYNIHWYDISRLCFISHLFLKKNVLLNRQHLYSPLSKALFASHLHTHAHTHWWQQTTIHSAYLTIRSTFGVQCLAQRRLDY